MCLIFASGEEVLGSNFTKSSDPPGSSNPDGIDEANGPRWKQNLEGFLDDDLAWAVEGAGGLVQEQHRGVLDDGARDRAHSRALRSRQGDTVNPSTS